MNTCALSGVVIVGSLRINETSGSVVFTLRTRNGMLREGDSDNEVFVSCVVLNAPAWAVERCKQLTAGTKLELQGRVQGWIEPRWENSNRKEKRRTAQVVVDAITLTFFSTSACKGDNSCRWLGRQDAIVTPTQESTLAAKKPSTLR